MIFVFLCENSIVSIAIRDLFFDKDTRCIFTGRLCQCTLPYGGSCLGCEQS
jgi:hypothetical protein